MKKLDKILISILGITTIVCYLLAIIEKHIPFIIFGIITMSMTYVCYSSTKEVKGKIGVKK